MKKLRAFGYVFKNSLLNLNYYQEIKNARLGFSLKYLFSLLFLISVVRLLPIIIGLLILAPTLPQAVTRLTKMAEDAYPPELVIKLQDGELSTNQKEPYFYKNLIVFDTQGKIEDYPKYKDKAYILVTKTAVVYPKDVFFFREAKQDFFIDYHTYLYAIKRAEPFLAYLQPAFWGGITILAILGPLVMTTLAWSGKVIGLAVLGLVIYLALKLTGHQYKYGQVYKMAVHASTLPIVFFVLLGIWGVSPVIPFGGTLLLVIFLALVFYHQWKEKS